MAYPVATLLPRKGMPAEPLDGEEDADTISNLLDTQFFQHGLITLEQVVSLEMIGWSGWVS